METYVRISNRKTPSRQNKRPPNPKNSSEEEWSDPKSETVLKCANLQGKGTCNVRQAVRMEHGVFSSDGAGATPELR